MISTMKTSWVALAMLVCGLVGCTNPPLSEEEVYRQRIHNAVTGMWDIPKEAEAPYSELFYTESARKRMLLLIDICQGPRVFPSSLDIHIPFLMASPRGGNADLHFLADEVVGAALTYAFLSDHEPLSAEADLPYTVADADQVLARLQIIEEELLSAPPPPLPADNLVGYRARIRWALDMISRDRPRIDSRWESEDHAYFTQYLASSARIRAILTSTPPDNAVLLEFPDGDRVLTRRFLNHLRDETEDHDEYGSLPDSGAIYAQRAFILTELHRYLEQYLDPEASESQRQAAAERLTIIAEELPDP
jgi:hypothetical protein